MITERGRESLRSRMIGNTIGAGRVHSEASKEKMSVNRSIYPRAEGKKYCSRCEKLKDLDEFHRSSSSKSGRAAFCKICSREIHKEYYQKNRDILTEKVRGRNKLPDVASRKRNRNLSINYGITEEEYQVILSEQDNACAICGTSQSGLNYKLYVDHDHKTGKVRGLLCKHCNSGIGLFRDDEDLLSKAILYLRNQ